MLLVFSLAAATHAQTYEVLQPGLFRVGNYWEFDSAWGTTSFHMTWQMVRTEQMGSVSTVVLRETAEPYYTDDMNVFLDTIAMSIVQVYETRYNPTQHTMSMYSDPLEKIPRYVNVTDLERPYGHGLSSGYLLEDPRQQWTRIQDQRITFVRTEVIAVPAGVFDCTVIRVSENWSYNTGWSGRAERMFWLNHIVGPIAMNYDVWEFYPNGTVYSRSIVTHQLRRFISAVPELVADQGSFAPNPATWGQTVRFDWRERCLYQNAYARHGTSIYLSTDTLITNRDTVLVSDKEIPPLVAGQIYPTSATAAIPQIAGGDYYVGIVVDARNEVVELDEANSFTLPTKLTVVAKCDLTVTSGTYVPPFLAPTEVLTVRTMISNIGGAVAPGSWAHVYLSTDNKIETSDSLLISGIQMPSLLPWTGYTFEGIALIPAGLPEGTYYVGVIADVNNAVNEVNEQNNALALPGTLFVGRADLEVTTASFAPMAIAPGNVLGVSGTVQNSGGAAVPATWAHIYLSTDTTIGMNDYPLITDIQVQPLAHGNRYTFIRTALVPSSFPEGTYCVGIVVDVGNTINEMNEQNNVFVQPNPLMIGRPDLQVTGGWFVPTLVTPGQQVAIQATIKNTGPLAAAASWANLYLSSDNVITSADIPLQVGLPCPSLAAGAVFTLNALPTIVPSIPMGAYYVGVICDTTGVVGEGNEINNGRALSGTLTIAKSDLQIDRLDFAPNVVKSSDTIRLAGSIINAAAVGTGNGFWLEFFVSPNKDFSPPRSTVCQSIYVPALPGYGRFSLAALERTILPSAPVGEFTFGVAVDRLNEVSESDESNNLAWVSARRIYIGVRPTRAEQWHLYR